jgi:hypothetical protein
MTTVQQALILGLALSACGKGGGSSSKTAGIELFGKTPVPPGDLAKVKAGMTQDQVKALFPGIKPTPNHSGSPSLSIDSGYSNVDYRIGFYSDKDAIADVSVVVPKDLGAKLETAWGPPAEAGMWPRWVNEERGYEGVLMAMGRKTTVSYKLFVPLSAEFFGAKPGPVDILTKVKLGMTRDEIAAAAPGFETAGADKGNGSYVPHEAAAKDVTVSIKYNQDNKAEQFVVELPPKGPDMLAKAWGPPRIVTPYGNDPTVQVQCWDSADGATSISVTPGTTKVPMTYDLKGTGLCRPQ